MRLTIAPTVLSLVDEHGTERIAPGAYVVTVGVKGSIEDEQTTETAGMLRGRLEVSGEPIAVFSLVDAKARANAKTHGVGCESVLSRLYGARQTRRAKES